MGNCAKKELIDDNTKNKDGISKLLIQTKTWSRDSHGLYDYETADIVQKTLKIAGSCQLIRDSNNEIHIVDSDNHEILTQSEYTPFVYIHYDEGLYWIYHTDKLEDLNCSHKTYPTLNKPETKLWKCVRQAEEEQTDFQCQNKHEIREGDVIKFGRAILKVNKICMDELDFNEQIANMSQQTFQSESTLHLQKLDGLKTKKDIDKYVRHSQPKRAQMFMSPYEDRKYQSSDDEDDSDSSKLEEKPTIAKRPYKKDIQFNDSDESRQEERTMRSASQHQTHQSEIPMCRICYMDDSCPKTNPLITPCKCDGTMKYIHVQCLRGWMESKLTIKATPGAKVYKWKKLECELCQCILEPQSEEAQFNFLNHELPESKSYIVLESVSSLIHGQKNKEVYVKDLAYEGDDVVGMVKLGRGHESHIRVSDISVSRFHSKIIQDLDKRKLYVQDNKSKFGSLILMKYPICISKTGNIKIQAGRTLLEIHVEQNTNSPQGVQKAPIRYEPKRVSTIENFGSVPFVKFVPNALEKKKYQLMTEDKINYFPISFLNQSQVENYHKIQMLKQKYSEQKSASKHRFTLVKKHLGDMEETKSLSDDAGSLYSECDLVQRVINDSQYVQPKTSKSKSKHVNVVRANISQDGSKSLRGPSKSHHIRSLSLNPTNQQLKNYQPIKEASHNLDDVVPVPMSDIPNVPGEGGMCMPLEEGEIVEVKSINLDMNDRLH